MSAPGTADADRVLLAIGRAVASSGEAFFDSIVRALCESLGTDAAFVAELLSDDPERVRTVALFQDGRIRAPVEYDLAGTPCEGVLGQHTCVFAKGVTERFPEDDLLLEMGAEGYLGTPLFSVDGRPLGLLAVIHGSPIEDVERAQLALEILASRAGAELERLQTRMSLKLQAAALEAADDGVAILDRDGTVVWVNPAFTDLTGYSEAEVVGRTLRVLDSGQQDEDFFQEMRNTMEAGETWQGELVNRRKDGTLYHEEQKITPVIDDRGQVTHFVTIKRDVTARARAQEELREARNRAQRYLDVAEIMLVALDDEGRVELINRKGLEVLGRDREEQLLGRDWFEECVPEGLREERRAWWRRARAEDSRSTQESVVLTRDGEERTILWHNVPLQDADGRFTGMLASGEDITRRRSLEYQLRHAQKMEAVGRMAGGIAHDFNNILTVILAEADGALAREPESPEVSEGLKQIRDAGARAAELVRRLLVFSRSSVLDRSPFDLNHMILESSRLMTRLLDESIEFDIDLSGGELTVLGDQSLIQQVLVNLVVNGADAMPEGGKLTVRSGLVHLDEDEARAKKVEPGVYGAVSVEDTGTGIEEELLEKIFDPFFSTKPKGEGTGLGLATGYGIVKQHEGFLGVESVVGQGTTFQLGLPLAPEAAGAEEESEVDPAPGGAETVLLVEDEAEVRAVVTRMLSGAGYRVIEAEDAEAAIEMHEDEAFATAPELLVTDVGLPGANGRELADVLAADLPGLSVLFMSGYNDDEVLGQRRTEEEVHFIRKPFSRGELLRAVRVALETGE